MRYRLRFLSALSFVSSFTLLAFPALLTLTGCGGDSGDGEEEIIEPPPAAAPNPIVSTQYFGQNGNLWKPRGDDHGGSPGSLVVLLSAQFTEQFDTCEVPMADGTIGQLICINNQPWTQTPYSCFTNGDRQTWRAPFGCEDAGDVKVTCKQENQEVIFTVPDGVGKNTCQRYG